MSNIEINAELRRLFSVMSLEVLEAILRGRVNLLELAQYEAADRALAAQKSEKPEGGK